MTKGNSRSFIYRTLAADYACDEALFGRDGTFVVEARVIPGRRNFPFRERELDIVTTGNSVVISTSPEYRPWVEENLAGLGRNDIFGFQAQAKTDAFLREHGQSLYGPILSFTCETGNLRVPMAPEGVEVEIIGRTEMLKLSHLKEFANAVSLKYDADRPNVMAAMAKKNGKIIGMAGASRDCEGLLQVGVNVLPEQREKGIGSLVVGKLTAAILESRMVPYYDTWAANIPSRNLAISVGYRPVFVEMFAGDPLDPEGG